jgi:hypothetical protein
VARVLQGGEINLTFRRNFENAEILEWEDMEGKLENVQLTNEGDTIRWALTPHEQFTTASLYRHCSFSRVVDVRIEDLWQSKLPLKIRNFVWLVYRDRIQMADNLRRKQ